ncbi:SDR family NAD(P)-dependent oxidoreductase [Aspergillus homomorphus CBS 101889]|uniref:3-oxoacyl-[acyl-carrier-protein] reductase n=1 Tax=Aspergillus homomorphus (strain CBS 101889) TaxID=1450537 RepID=A0A395HIY5_ASPHC|nr:NAD(P)-binding protein [Aspergillus homomorphus CBS 101889]RAL07881.1 NAD(P)-binding protein [Aspergillus homomorphus CBS 101889]
MPSTNNSSQLSSLSANLGGKTAIVTGSSIDIDAGIAVDLGRRGAAVVITYTSERSRDAAYSVAKTIDDSISGGKGLPASPQDTIDILIHNAADGEDRFLEDVTGEFFNKMTDLNLKGVYDPRVVPHMPRGGRIVLITSAAARMGVTQKSVYVVTKAGHKAF